MNWGKGIAIFYTIFAGTMIFAVIRSTKYDNSLVSEKYYQDDIAYQQHFDRKQNSKELKEPLLTTYQKESNQLKIQFPDNFQTISGTVHLFCPSSSEEDIKIPIQLDDEINQQTLSVEGFKKGLWKVKINWEGDGVDFYDEKTLVL